MRGGGGLDLSDQGFKVVEAPEPDVREVAEALDETDWKLEKILNNGIDFGDNVRGGFVEVKTTGETQEVQHGLGHPPIGFLVILKDGPGDVYATRVEEWTKETLFLRSSVSNLTVRLFVL